MKLLTTLVLLFSAALSFGQQESIPSQFWNNTTQINPAFAGLEYRLRGGIFYRNQWSGASGPEDIYGFYSMRIGEKWGVGINLDRNATGLGLTSNIAVPVSYRITLDDESTLAIGASLGFSQIDGEPSVFYPPTLEDDPYIFQLRGRKLLGHAGIAYRNRWITGAISMRTLELAEFGENTFDYEPYFNTLVSLRLPVGYLPQYLKLSDARLEAIHSYQNGFQRMQIDLRLTYFDKLSVFTGYVFNEQFLVGAGFDFYKKFRVSYSVGFNRSALTTSQPSYTHEAALIYQLPLQD